MFRPKTIWLTKKKKNNRIAFSFNRWNWEVCIDLHKCPILIRSLKVREMKQDPCEIQAKWFIRDSCLCGTSIIISCRVTPACFLCNLYKREQIFVTSFLLLLSTQPFQNGSDFKKNRIPLTREKSFFWELSWPHMRRDTKMKMAWAPDKRGYLG